MSELGGVVLIAEGNDGLRSHYGRWLAEEDYEVVLAANGLEALELTRVREPLVVLMNLDLPGLDGWEATRVLRRDPLLHTTVVIALTGWAVKTRDSDARSAGCDGVLRAPARREDLLAIVAHYAPPQCDGRGSFVRLRAAPAATAEVGLGRRRA
jgi:CheY-like chemotaxis protein